MKYSLSLLIAVFPIALCNAGTGSGPGASPLLLEPGSIVVTTSEPQTSYGRLDEKTTEGLQLFARADQDENEQHGQAKGHDKDKAKGKAKGHHKDKEGDNDADDQKTSKDSTPANSPPVQQPATPVKPASAQTGTAAAAPQAPVAAHTVAAKSPAEVKTEMDHHLREISTLDKNTATSKARYTTISQETGVPVSTLEAQHKANPVGSGGLLIANEMARATGKPAGTFLKERLQGKDWNKIAAENKFDLAPVLPKLDRLQLSMQGAVKK